MAVHHARFAGLVNRAATQYGCLAIQFFFAWADSAADGGCFVPRVLAGKVATRCGVRVFGWRTRVGCNPSCRVGPLGILGLTWLGV